MKGALLRWLEEMGSIYVLYDEVDLCCMSLFRWLEEMGSRDVLYDEVDLCCNSR
jgi:hypothetical protein